MLGDHLILTAAAAAAGGINSIAGGGTLLTFPALMHALGNQAIGSADAAVIANATSTVALLPGSLTAITGYREEFRQVRRWAEILILPSAVGGLLGSLLVTLLPPETFEACVPWLILTAASLFMLQPYIARWVGIGKPHAPATPRTVWGVALFQFFVSIYGGYFGAGIGILMLSGLAMMGLTDIHQMNALKSLLGSVINAVSAVVFVVQGKVHWQLVAPMLVAAMVGGYAGSRLARRMNRSLVRNIVVAVGFSLATYYFVTK